MVFGEGAMPVSCVRCFELILPLSDLMPAHPVQDGLTGATLNEHLECSIRSVIGSVNHLNKTCSCFVPGSTEGDPPGMTRRQAAKAAADLYFSMHPELVNPWST